LREGKAVAIPVEIGIDDESFVEIAAGNMKPGDHWRISVLRRGRHLLRLLSGAQGRPPRSDRGAALRVDLMRDLPPSNV
jgi:hypothetical protein